MGRPATRASALAVLVAGLAACQSHAPIYVETRLEPDALPVFWGGGRKHRELVAIPPEQWQEIVDHFRPPAATPWEERVAISEAVGLMERICGEQTPMRWDRSKNSVDSENPVRLDCIDESTNTTIFLLLFQQQGLLHWHEVMSRLRRLSGGFLVHYSAQVRDLQTGRLYAIDSWFEDNGVSAHVQNSEDWQRKVKPPQDVE